LCPTQPNPDGSRFFGSPTKLFEYMSLGKPIIASDLEQVGDVLRNNSFGSLLQPYDIKGFVDAALNILDTDATTLIDTGYKARAHAITKYSWKQHSANIISFIKENSG